jgi:hypothetical protein
MAGWNGAGVFVLPYSMVAEAASGVKILASHQDTQWNAIKAGLENCLTRDGQNAMTAALNMGGFQISNVGAPVNPGDVVTKAYSDSAAVGEWMPESYSASFVSVSSFKVNGVDATARYHPGRRVKVIHLNGTRTNYGTVISSSFSADTTVVIAVDGGFGLAASVTTVSYGGQSYVPSSYLDPRSAVLLTFADPFSVGTARTKLNFDTTLLDANGEVGGGSFICRYPGYYLVSGQVTYLVPGGGVAYVQGTVNGSVGIEVFNVLPANSNLQSVPIPSTVMKLVKGDNVGVYLQNLAATIEGSGPTLDTYLSVSRIV